MLLKGRDRSIVGKTYSSKLTTVSSMNHRWTHLGLNPKCRGDWKCKNNALTTRGWVEVGLQAFLAAAVIGRDLAVSLSCSVTSAERAGLTYWRNGYVGQRSKLDAAAKRKVSPISAIDLRHPAHSLVAVHVIRDVGYCRMYILFPSICRNGYCSNFETSLSFPYVVCTRVQRRGAKFPDARSPALDIFKVGLTFVAPQHGIFFISSLWCLEF
jgi:hypothetical protein